ncbi:hypothetical protein K1T71_013543 [Dendrolimus kikuchii]|uniref:Uncharacterized protein n=1 Tax=Dendrolimus kikuchii TaxID=765133 RepID=A0ACC1CGS2_9NEOP|nr:hypothetical protein K1T71_013543 [Dendrolimus kikuchii]
MLALFYQMKSAKKKWNIDIASYYTELKSNNCNIKPKFERRCRVCLMEATVDMSSTDFTKEDIDIFQSITNLNISELNEYMKYLCNFCFKFIKGAVLFRKTAQQSDEILRQPVKEEVLLDSQSCHEFSDSDDFKPSLVKDWSILEQDVTEMKVEKKEKIKYTPKITCHVCNKVLNKSYYKEHMTMHDPNHRKYICDVCGKSFRLRCAYHNHSLRHRTDFPFKCQFCPYRGRYSELLKTHMRTHTGDYRYMCTVCPARFLFKSNLNSHMLKHKDPQHKCDDCKRAFHTKLMLQRHYEADHLGIKNHVCNICGKAFGYRNAMMKHQRHVHNRQKMQYGRMPSYLEAEQKQGRL